MHARSRSPALTALRECVRGLRPGIVRDVAAVEAGLAACWHQLDGGNERGIEPHKLRGRTADMVWEPPLLRFRLERHGGTVQGSSRADLQDWTKDTNAATATVSVRGYRQLYRQEPRARS